MQLSPSLPLVTAEAPAASGLSILSGNNARLIDGETDSTSFDELLHPDAEQPDSKLTDTAIPEDEAAALFAVSSMMPVPLPVPLPHLSVAAEESDHHAEQSPEAILEGGNNQALVETGSRCKKTTGSTEFAVASSVRSYAVESRGDEKNGSVENQQNETLADGDKGKTLESGGEVVLQRPSFAKAVPQPAQGKLADQSPLDENLLRAARLDGASQPGRVNLIPMMQSTETNLSTVQMMPQESRAAEQFFPDNQPWRRVIQATDGRALTAGASVESNVGQKTEIATERGQATPNEMNQPVVSLRQTGLMESRFARGDQTEEQTAHTFTSLGKLIPIPVVAASPWSRPVAPVTKSSVSRVVNPGETAGMAKVAAIAQSTPVVQSAPESIAQKQFLPTQPELDKSMHQIVGIDVARERTTMASTLIDRPKSAVIADKSAFAPADWIAPSIASASLTTEKPLPSTTVRETIAAVLTAVEAMASRADKAQSAVKMDFQIGSEKLGLQLALRDGMVYTIFRTDSADLRTALGQEWQAVMPSSTAREGHVAPPVFASAATNGSDSAFGSLGHGQPQSRGQQSQESTFSHLGRMPDSDQSGTASVEPAPAPFVSTSSLNAFA